MHQPIAAWHDVSNLNNAAQKGCTDVSSLHDMHCRQQECCDTVLHTTSALHIALQMKTCPLCFADKSDDSSTAQHSAAQRSTAFT